jgi:peptidoglycan/LPS O-acetylase OafA/YrhL
MPITVDVLNPASGSPAPTAIGQAKSHYRPQLDGLRFFAFLAVFLQHTFHAEPAYYLTWSVFKPLHLSFAAAALLSKLTLTGGMGVDLFFALSSYLITELLLRERMETGDIHLKYFYARRVLRIWPVYALVLFLGFVVIPALGLGEAIPPVYIAAYLLFAGNWSCAFLGVAPALHTISQLWSVSIEEQFYFFWPLSLRKLGVERLKWLCIGLIVTGELTRLILCLSHASKDLLYFSTFTHLDPIAWGALLAVYKKDPDPQTPMFQRMLLGAICVVAVAVTLLHGPEVYYFSNLVAYPFYALCCAIILFIALQSKILAVKPLPYLGKISYGLYAYHAMVIILLNQLVPQGTWLRSVLLPAKFIVTIAVAALSYKVLETPILKFKDRFTYIRSRPV